MAEYRQDPLTGERVIVAPGRARRPDDWRESRQRAPIPHYSVDCPFCPGNEDRLLRVEREWKSGDAAGWSVRAVPNRYPAVGGIGKSLDHAGCEIHEVLVEGPDHDRDLADFSIAELSLVLSAYRDRFLELARRNGVRTVVLFRNRGGEAGASLKHPHAQIMTLPDIPPRLLALEARARAAYDDKGACPTCLIVADELQRTIRVVSEERAFLTLVPFAALGPFEQVIVPKAHRSSFADNSPGDLQDLAVALRRALLRLRNLLNDPPYNFFFESSLGDADSAPFRHWRMRLVPRLTIAGGFERMAGMSINPSRPEDDARLLRTVLTS